MSESSETILVELKHRPIKRIFGLVDHWYVNIPSQNLEVHMGGYDPGTHLTSGTTKGGHVYSTVEMCSECLECLLKSTFDLKPVLYYPFINCETLIATNFFNVAVSSQVVLLTAAISCVLIGLFKPTFIYIALLLFVIYFAYSKYTYSHTWFQKCAHVQRLSV